MINYASKAPTIKVIDGFVEVTEDQYIQLDEVSGTTPLDTVLVMGRAWRWLWSSANGEAVVPSAMRLYRLGSSKRIRDLALVTLHAATRTTSTGFVAAWQCAEVALAWRPSSAVVFAPAVPSVRGGCLRDGKQWL